MSHLEQLMQDQLQRAILPMPEVEYAFGYGKHRFDFAWPEIMLAVEVEGGTFVKGRHSRGAGYARDAKKYNAAQIRGWTVIRVTSDMLNDLSGIKDVVDAFNCAVMVKTVRGLKAMGHFKNGEEPVLSEVA